MHIGVIVYSHTGHTLSVARKLEERLSAAGHSVALKQLEPAEPIPLSAERAELKTYPPVDGYDGLVFGSPVRGGHMSGPMASYLEQSPSLEGKDAVCLVTGVFPAAWGRNQTLNQMEAVCESKGATVLGSGSVGWWSLTRRRKIAQVVDRLSGRFSSG